MKNLYIKQKVLSLRDKFTIMNEAGHDEYYVSGSFLKIPKSFEITNNLHEQVGVITKKTFSLLPKFFVEVDGEEVLTIKKELSFFKAKYTIEGQNIEVHGNWWDMNFDVLEHGKIVGKVNKKWISWGDSYEIQIINDQLEKIVIAIVIAIDCVKSDEDRAAASSS